MMNFTHDDETDSENEALMWMQDMFQPPYSRRTSSNLEYNDQERNNDILRKLSQPHGHYLFCNEENPMRPRPRLDISNNDDIPSCSGLTRAELLKIIQRSKNVPDGGASFSVLSPEDEMASNDLKSGLDTAKDPSVLDRQLEYVGVNDDDEAVAVSPCGRFLKYPHVVGMGSVKTVFRGLDSQAGVPVAWCELLEKRVSKSERQRFREEAELLKQLQHPNIVRFYSSWEISSFRRKSFVLITELMTSGTLKAYLKRFKILNSKVFKDWCTQILKALQYLHSRKPLIIHRDLKCDNIFITGASGLVKIGDLGLSTRKYGSFAKSVVGTPEFMAPEMYEEHYDESVDIYAFGMCMLEMTIAEYPYSECSTPTQIYKRVTAGIKPTGLERVHDLKTRAIIEWCIEYRKQDRPTCRALLASDYFADEATFKLSPIFPEIYLSNTGIDAIEFRLQLLDPKKRSHQQDEAILFSFDTHRDCCKTVAQEMFKSGIIGPEDAKLIEKILQSHVDMLQEERKLLEINKSRPMQPCLDFIPSSARDCIPSIIEDEDDNCRNLEDLIFGPRFVKLSSNVIALCMEKATRSAIRLPKLSVTNIENHTLVYCLLDNKPMLISFKFDVACIDVTTCAENLSKEGLLNSTQIEWFLNTLEDIIHQVKRDPTRLPKTLFPDNDDLDGSTTEDKKHISMRRKLTFTPDTKPPAPICTYSQSNQASFMMPRGFGRSSIHSSLRHRSPRTPRINITSVEDAFYRGHGSLKNSIRPPTPPPNFPIRQQLLNDNQLNAKKQAPTDRKLQSIGAFQQRPMSPQLVAAASRQQITVSQIQAAPQQMTYHKSISMASKQPSPTLQQNSKLSNFGSPRPIIARSTKLNHQKSSTRSHPGQKSQSQQQATKDDCYASHRKTPHQGPTPQTLHAHQFFPMQRQQEVRMHTRIPIYRQQGPEQQQEIDSFLRPHVSLLKQQKSHQQQQQQPPPAVFIPRNSASQRPPPLSPHMEMYNDPIHFKQYIAPGANPNTPVEEFFLSFVDDQTILQHNAEMSLQQYNVASFPQYPILTTGVLQPPQPLHQHTGFNMGICIDSEELLPLATTNPTILPAVFKSDIKSSLDTTRNLMCGIRLDAEVRQRLLLLFQRQYIEEEELRLRHLFELEEFLRLHKTACFFGELGEASNIALTQQMATARQFLNQAGIGDGACLHLNPLYRPPQQLYPGQWQPQCSPIPAPRTYAGPTTRPQQVPQTHFRRFYYQQPCYFNGAAPTAHTLTMEASLRTPLSRPILGVASGGYINGVSEHDKQSEVTALVPSEYCMRHDQ